MKNKLILTTLAVIYGINNFAQSEMYDEYMDEEDIKDFERYAHLGLTKYEIILIVIGLVLLLIAKNITIENTYIRNALFIIGGIFCLPLLLVILAVAQKLLGYAIILAVIVGGIYYLFGLNK